jgi:hypothetical protein
VDLSKSAGRPRECRAFSCVTVVTHSLVMSVGGDDSDSHHAAPQREYEYEYRQAEEMWALLSGSGSDEESEFLSEHLDQVRPAAHY